MAGMDSSAEKESFAHGEGEHVGLWALALLSARSSRKHTAGIPLRLVIATLGDLGFDVDPDIEMQDLLVSG